METMSIFEKAKEAFQQDYQAKQSAQIPATIQNRAGQLLSSGRVILEENHEAVFYPSSQSGFDNLRQDEAFLLVTEGKNYRILKCSLCGVSHPHFDLKLQP